MSALVYLHAWDLDVEVVGQTFYQTPPCTLACLPQPPRLLRVTHVLKVGKGDQSGHHLQRTQNGPACAVQLRPTSITMLQNASLALYSPPEHTMNKRWVRTSRLNPRM